jgi:ABC-type glycerol-3-phosphate transport system substrate-binding protein
MRTDPMRWTRRAVVRAALAAAGAVAGPAVLTACGPQGPTAPSAAAPLGGSAPVVLVLAPWGGWPSYGGAHWQQFVQPALDQFQSQHPGIQVRLVAPGGGGSFLTPILAGTAPDVFQDWAIGPYRAAGAVLALDKYLRQDNVDPTIWSPGQLHAMRDEEGIQFLPCYVHVTVMAVNYSILDSLGLQYPDPDWTWQQAEQLYRACSRTVNGKRRYGVSMYFTGQDMGDPSSMSTYVAHFFGGSVGDPNRMTCHLDDPKSYTGIQWVEQLHWDNVISPNARDSDLQNIAFVEAGSASLPRYLQSWRDQFKWSFFPVPHFPGGQFSFEATDYYAINAGTRHPDESWILLKWLAAEPFWSRYCMHYLLRTPSLVSLWDEYAQVVEAVAPLVKGKGMQYFSQAAAKWGIANTVFKYNQPQVCNLINQQLARCYRREASVPEAMHLAAQQVNALEAVGEQEAARVETAKGRFPTTGPELVPVPAGI